MSRSLTASDRSALIRLASSMPAGSPERKAILKGLGANRKVASQWKTTPRDPLEEVIMLALASALDDAGMDVLQAEYMNITLEEAVVSVRVGSKVGVVVNSLMTGDDIFTKDYSWGVPVGTIAKDVSNAL